MSNHDEVQSVVSKLGAKLLSHYAVSDKSKQASRGMWGSAGLEMAIHANIFRHAILTAKVGQTDLIVGVRSGFIIRSGDTLL